MFDAQPTASERQRENLSSRLRREFGLALPEDDDARPATDPSGTTPQGLPFGREVNLSQVKDLGTWTPNLTSHSADAWPHPAVNIGPSTFAHSLDGSNFQTNRNVKASNTLPGCDNLVLLGETAQNLASLEFCRGNVPSDGKRNSPGCMSGRRFKLGRRGV